MTFDWLSIPLLVDAILFGMALGSLVSSGIGERAWRARHPNAHLLSGALLLLAMKLALAAAPPPLIAATPSPVSAIFGKCEKRYSVNID